MPDITVDITDLQVLLAVDQAEIDRAVRLVLADAGIRHAHVNVVIVDDAQIESHNRQYLHHDYPTDVLSFGLQEQPLEGEVLVNAEMARRRAAEFAWKATDELLWYVVHGTLHLVGYDDASFAARASMRRREVEVLARLGVPPPPNWDDEC
jgi:probable rRNA maturation factor